VTINHLQEPLLFLNPGMKNHRSKADFLLLAKAAAKKAAECEG
jgi:hypothetical protein